MFRYSLACFLFASSAVASCPQGQTPFLSFDIEGRSKVLSVCYDEQAAHYSFGPRAGPAELTLSESYETLGYTPWPGMGRAIWVTVTFTNGQYTYTVAGGVDRMFGDEDEADHPSPEFGSFTVRKSGQLLAEFACDRTSTDFLWPENLSAYKEAAGFEWDDKDRVWKRRQ